MAVSVPTSEQFDALEARVAALEHAQTPDPPDPPTEPVDGVQAKRIAWLCELMGVNTFSSLDEHNLWGSWPADYRPESVIAALRYITGGTRYCLPVREYHYAARTEMQKEWLRHLHDAFPAMKVTICVGANGSPDDVPSLVGMSANWFEGLNEPNTDFGSGQVPFETTMAIQQDIWATGSSSVSIMGPSIVAGMPNPQGWIEQYCGSSGLRQLNTRMNYGNGHYYPPHCPDLTGDGTSVSEYVGGLWTAYEQHPIMLTEFHPTLYNSAGHKPGEPGWSGQRDAYYMMLALFRAAKCGVTGLWWYALFDYGSTYVCGLFPKSGADSPRPAATALRNLCGLCADPGSDLRTFSPGKLAVTVTGPVGGNWDWDLYQASDGTFFITLWRAAPEPGGAPVEVSVDFATPPRQPRVYDVLTGAAQPVALDGTRLPVALDAGCRVIIVPL